MKTTLPEAITTIDEAKQFLAELAENKEAYHPEDDAFDVVWETAEVSEIEKTQLNKLMNDIYSLPEAWNPQNPDGFDPCGYLLEKAIVFYDDGILYPFEITGKFKEHRTGNGEFLFTPDWFESTDAEEWYNDNWERVNDAYNNSK